ncbi:hypothetical protein GCM10027398_26850 [Azotobacter salinestris]
MFSHDVSLRRRFTDERPDGESMEDGTVRRSGVRASPGAHDDGRNRADEQAEQGMVHGRFSFLFIFVMWREQPGPVASGADTGGKSDGNQSRMSDNRTKTNWFEHGDNDSGAAP